MKGKLHDWRIEDREYARQEERRGRRYAFETLLPGRTALVVIDMVPFFVSGGGYCLSIVPHISSIAGALRKTGGTVAWVVPAAADRMAVSEEFFGPEVAAAFRRSGGDGPVAGRIWEGLDVHPGDLLAEKPAFRAFFPGSCPLPSLLEERRISTVLITGTVTNVCCESSARDASTLGYRVSGHARAACADRALLLEDELGIDSLAELVEVISARAGIVIPDEETGRVRTVGDLQGILDAHAPGAAPPPPEMRTP